MTLEAGGANGVLDAAQFNQLCGGDADRGRALLELYRKSTLDDLQVFERALKQGPAAIVSVAHRMKGAAQWIGARDIARIAAQAERLGRAPGAADLSSLAGALRDAVSAFEQRACVRLASAPVQVPPEDGGGVRAALDL